MSVTLQLEIADGLKLFAQRVFVEGLVVELAGVFDTWVTAVLAPSVVDTLMGELSRPIHVDLIDDIGDIDG